MQTDLDQANAEISLLRKQVKSLEESLKFTRAEQDEVKERVNTCEEDQMRNEDELIRQNIYSRRWNLIFYGIEESETENCSAIVKDVMLSSLKINEEIVNSTKFCGVHRLGKSKQISGRPRPVIARFTCREDRELVWRQRYNLKGSRYSLAEDLPPAVRKIRKTILVPAMKEARKTAGTRATLYLQQNSKKMEWTHRKLNHELISDLPKCYCFFALLLSFFSLLIKPLSKKMFMLIRSAKEKSRLFKVPITPQKFFHLVKSVY